MSIERLPDHELWEKHRKAVCRHPEHEIPGLIALPPGSYKHTCPGCGKSVIFVVPEGGRMRQVRHMGSDRE